MALLRFLLCLFIFIGAIATSGALVFSIVLILRFPPLLAVVLLALWILRHMLRLQHTLNQNTHHF